MNKGLLVTSNNFSNIFVMNKLQKGLLQNPHQSAQILFSRSSKHKPLKPDACKTLISNMLISPGSTEQ